MTPDVDDSSSSRRARSDVAGRASGSGRIEHEVGAVGLDRQPGYVDVVHQGVEVRQLRRRGVVAAARSASASAPIGSAAR